MTVKVGHCERSEAISWAGVSKLEIAASLLLLAMTEAGIASSLSLLYARRVSQ